MTFIVRFSSQCAYSKKVMPLWGHLLGFPYIYIYIYTCYLITQQKTSYTEKQLHYEGLSSVA